MARRALHVLVIVVLSLAALLPALALRAPDAFGWFDGPRTAILSAVGWLLALAMWIDHRRLSTRVARMAPTLGLEFLGEDLERNLERYAAEIKRKHDSMLVNLTEGQIRSNDELAGSLQRIVAYGFEAFDAESAELALFDKDSGLYHSSFVLGKPFAAGAQAMLDDPGLARVIERTPEVLVQPMAFAGGMLGTLRVALKKGRRPSPADRALMGLLALQGAVAIVNSNYTGEIMRMKSASEESVRAKTGFLANLSHELRGPLGIILNAVELVLDGLCGPVSADQRETLTMVRGNCAHLLELINDVLDYAKVESGKTTVDPQEIDVHELLGDLSGVVRGQADAKRHRLTYKPSDGALAIRCDRRHARQMLINLLTNAIKYTPEGGTVELWAERTPGGKVRINVKDSGVGIEDAEREKVFAAFERLSNAYSLAQAGSGLGMPLTRKLAEANGGTIDFDSTPGKGSLFWIVLPAAAPGALLDKDKGEKSENDGPLGAGETVLLLGDGQGEEEMLAKYLEHAGFVIARAADLDAAVSALKGGAPRVMVAENAFLDDIGLDRVREMRQSAAKPVPLLMLSSKAFTFDIESYLKAGVDRCLSKPLPLREIAKVCGELIRGAQEPASPNQPAAGLPKRPRGVRDDMLH